MVSPRQAPKNWRVYSAQLWTGDGVVPEDALTQRRYVRAELATTNPAGIDHQDPKMARIAMRPTRFRVLDVQAGFLGEPSAEQSARRGRS